MGRLLLKRIMMTVRGKNVHNSFNRQVDIKLLV